MVSVGAIFFAALIAALLGWRLGYENAHLTIARECERLGGFYVQDKTYVCTLKSAEPQEQMDE